MRYGQGAVSLNLISGGRLGVGLVPWRRVVDYGGTFQNGAPVTLLAATTQVMPVGAPIAVDVDDLIIINWEIGGTQGANPGNISLLLYNGPGMTATMVAPRGAPQASFRHTCLAGQAFVVHATSIFHCTAAGDADFVIGGSDSGNNFPIVIGGAGAMRFHARTV
jgi:hypothetical protein